MTESLSKLGLFGVTILLLAAGCTYDESLGRDRAPLARGHLEARWSVTLGGACTSADLVTHDDNGDVLVAGSGQDAATPIGFVAKLGALDGEQLWSHVLPATHVQAILSGPNNATYVVTQTGTATTLLKFSSAGALEWRQELSGWNDVTVVDIAVAPTGELYLGGSFRGSIQLSSDLVVSLDEGDAFLAKVSASGNVLWGKTFAGAGVQGIGALGVTTDGILATANTYGGVASFGGPPMQSTTGNAVAIVKFDRDGAFQWSRELAPSQNVTDVWLGFDELQRPIAVGAQWSPSSDQGQLVTWIGSLEDHELDQNQTAQSWLVGRPAIAPNGMIAGGAMSDSATKADIRVFDSDGTMLGGGSYQMAGAPVVDQGFDLRSFTATNHQIIAAGTLFYAVDFGDGLVWSHHATQLSDGSPLSGGADAVVVDLEWVTN